MSMRVSCRMSGSAVWLDGLVHETAKVTMVEL